METLNFRAESGEGPPAQTENTQDIVLTYEIIKKSAK